jgi:probable rRNA maturation factor
MLEIALQIEEQFEADIDTGLLDKAVKAVINWARPTSNRVASVRSVNVVITDNETIQQLNHQYRGIDSPTDVLSFENRPDPDFPEVGDELTGHLGDIIIAYPVAKTQAQAGGHTPQQEAVLLTVHGMLHLLGFDHDTPAHKADMWQAQQQIMTGLGLAQVQPTEA